eukprot:TRINITY_DN13359_c0_g1_i1.p2 TRINITY_DN13359_c0_g1~~TRINITY_DN13359_c0_g1_i1.p2  ORF type:complete len:411 (+),score=122.36 TRINITY_DN13359_c0_g1_i1:24-1235(+)
MDSRAQDIFESKAFGETLFEITLAQGGTGPQSKHYVKLRPYAKEFIQNLGKLFDIRVFTWGLRHYAQEVVKLLDPDDKTIHSKIVTRDDCTDTMNAHSREIQQKDLNRIFPCSESMVIVVDDDPRVWASAQKNLLTIPKFEFFPIASEYAHGRSASSAGVSSSGFELEALKSRDNENILQSYERFLITLHGLFFRYLEVNEKLSDVRFLIENIRSQILQDVSIVFSGVFPKEIPFVRNREVMIANDYGALVFEDFPENHEITHLICARKNTEKHKKAMTKGIHAVSPKWLWASIFHFQRMPEIEFQVEAEVSSEYFCKNLLSVGELVEKMSQFLDEMYGISLSPESRKRKREDELHKEDVDESDDFADLEELNYGEEHNEEDGEEQDDFEDLEQELDAALDEE